MALHTFHRGNTKITLRQGDIIQQDTDAIVNAANSSLMGGGGVDGAIHRAGGPRILQECMAIRRRDWPNGLETGNAVITTGGNLRARYVIHTVGPVWRGGKNQEPEKLASAHKNSLNLAISKKLNSISFPAISTGAYGYPIALASKVAVASVKEVLEEHDEKTEGHVIHEIRFVLFTRGDFESYVRAAGELLIPL